MSTREEHEDLLLENNLKALKGLEIPEGEELKVVVKRLKELCLIDLEINQILRSILSYHNSDDCGCKNLLKDLFGFIDPKFYLDEHGKGLVISTFKWIPYATDRYCTFIPYNIDLTEAITVELFEKSKTVHTLFEKSKLIQEELAQMNESVVILLRLFKLLAYSADYKTFNDPIEVPSDENPSDEDPSEDSSEDSSEEPSEDPSEDSSEDSSESPIKYNQMDLLSEE